MAEEQTVFLQSDIQQNSSCRKGMVTNITDDDYKSDPVKSKEKDDDESEEQIKPDTATINNDVVDSIKVNMDSNNRKHESNELIDDGKQMENEINADNEDEINISNDDGNRHNKEDVIDIKQKQKFEKSEAQELMLIDEGLSGDAADDDIDDNETDLTDGQCELGDNIDFVYYKKTNNSMTIESDLDLPENINLLPSKSDLEAFADLYDPQLIIQKPRRCINCIIL